MHRTLKWPLIDKDDPKDVLIGQSSCLSKDANDLAYSIMLRVAERQLLSGISVIVDSPLARGSLYVRALEIAPKVLQGSPQDKHDYRGYANWLCNSAVEAVLMTSLEVTIASLTGSFISALFPHCRKPLW